MNWLKDPKVTHAIAVVFTAMLMAIIGLLKGVGQATPGLTMTAVAAAGSSSWICTACTQNPVPKPPSPDAGTGGAQGTGGNASTGGTPSTGGQAATGGASAQSLEQQACSNLLLRGCPEGLATNCAGILQQRCSSPKVKCNLPCLVSAPSKAVIQSTCKLACGAL